MKPAPRKRPGAVAKAAADAVDDAAAARRSLVLRLKRVSPVPGEAAAQRSQRITRVLARLA